MAEKELGNTDIELKFKTAIPADIKDWTNQTGRPNRPLLTRYASSPIPIRTSRPSAP